MTNTLSAELERAQVPVAPLVFVPALITLAVTVLRVIGELQHWSTRWFNPAPGGGGAIVGIVWLVPPFGVYFALRLSKSGARPERVGRAILYAVVGFILLAAGFLLFQMVLRDLKGLVAMWVLAALGAALQILAWRALFNVLAAYAYAARIPVAVIMYLATVGVWDSHYSALALPTSQLNMLAQYFLFGFFPQLVWWVSFTIIVGTLFGGIAAAVTRRGQAAPGATSP